MCLHRELAQCSGEDVTLVKTSLRYLLEGFQVNGHCKHVTLTERRDDTEEHVTGRSNSRTRPTQENDDAGTLDFIPRAREMETKSRTGAIWLRPDAYQMMNRA